MFIKILKLSYFTLVLLVLTTACQRSGVESDKLENENEKIEPLIVFDLAKIKERGKIIGIVENSSTGYFLYKGQPMGYDYELLNSLADYLEVTLEIKLTTSINEAYKMLNNGEGDIFAYSLTVTKDRKKRVAFTRSHFTTRQVLVQAKPDNWRSMTLNDIDKSLIRNQVNLIGKQVHVRKRSAYIRRLKNLSDEIGGDIIIIEEPDTVETEQLIKLVSEGEIPLTVADEMVAKVNEAYYSNLDTKTPISFPQKIAWAVRTNAPNLLSEMNNWLISIKRVPTFNVIYNKYYKKRRGAKEIVESEFSSIGGNSISPYDDIVKEQSTNLGWDWKLIVAQMYRESRFEPDVKSWAGAYGLMQLVPETGKRFGANDLFDPQQNISAAVNYMIHLDSLWSKSIDDKTVRQKFVLASYNVGLAHVVDARNLAEEFGADPTLWDDNVEKYLLLKTKKEYFTHPIVESGYCRGEEPVEYVKDIFQLYKLYQQLIKD